MIISCTQFFGFVTEDEGGFGVALANLRNDSALGMTSLASALSLAIGIGLQNIPEGLAVALPFKSETKNTTKAFYMVWEAERLNLLLQSLAFS